MRVSERGGAVALCRVSATCWRVSPTKQADDACTEGGRHWHARRQLSKGGGGTKTVYTIVLIDSRDMDLLVGILHPVRIGDNDDGHIYVCDVISTDFRHMFDWTAECIYSSVEHNSN
jgi:hypothetical protein